LYLVTYNMHKYIHSITTRRSSDLKKKGDEKFLPDVSEGMVVDAKKITPNQHFTQPPPRYTEARLVRAMEEKGIGRPSTYAPTLDTIQRRGYVSVDNRRFIPTEQIG